MRIAMLAPLYETIPPARYGGTERVVSYLTEELTRRGHTVTLYACGGSRTSGSLVEVSPGPLSGSERLTDPLAYHVFQIGIALENSDDYDLIHSHCDFRAIPFIRSTRTPVLSTNHNRLDAPENQTIIEKFPEAPVTALSRSHQRQLPTANWVGVCYNGVPVDDFPFSPSAGAYLAFVGRLSPEKGPLEAIELSERAGIPLKIVAKINDWERSFFDEAIRPRLAGSRVEYLGELDEDAKRDFLANALALLFPIVWEEPFGMVLVEAMATGTPVIAFRRGAVPEIVDDGRTGYLCDDVDTMVRRIQDLSSLDRHTCRAEACRRFSVNAMTDAYELTYRRVLGREP